MIAALVLSLAIIPAWAFGGSLAVLAIGAFVMQTGVQGAWGIIPAHLNELSPDGVRGLMPGLAYQLGILLAAGTNTIEYALRNRLGYGWALSTFEFTNILLLVTVIGVWRRAKGTEIHAGSRALTEAPPGRPPHPLSATGGPRTLGASVVPRVGRRSGADRRADKHAPHRSHPAQLPPAAA